LPDVALDWPSSDFEKKLEVSVGAVFGPQIVVMLTSPFAVVATLERVGITSDHNDDAGYIEDIS
jgi:hypothetical protein